MISKNDMVGRWKIVRTDRKGQESDAVCEFTEDGAFHWLKPLKLSKNYEINGDYLYFIYRGGAKSRPLTVSEDGGLLKVTASDGNSDWLERQQQD